MTLGPYANRQRDTLLRLPLTDLAAWHLVAVCPACRVERFVRVADLLTRYGGHTSLAGLVPRLRCAEPACRRPPASVRLRNRFPPHPGPALIDVVLVGRM